MQAISICFNKKLLIVIGLLSLVTKICLLKLKIGPTPITALLVNIGNTT